MAKIDTSKIEGYVSMSVEDKIKALEALEYDDNAAELERLRKANDKLSSESAEWKRKHNALLSEEEKKKQEDADKLAQMEQELAGLRKDKTVSEYKAKFLAQGYSEELAGATALALADGDTATVFANQQKFLDEYTKTVKAENLKGTPRPPAGSGSEGIDYAKKIEEAQTSGDMAAVAYYTRLQAQQEAEASK